MPPPQIEITFLFTPEDPPLTSEMCQGTLQGFLNAVQTAGFDVSSAVSLQESAGSEAVLLGHFFINLVDNKDVWLVVGPLIAAWLTRRNGRKLRLKVSPDGFEAEAQTKADLDNLIARAENIQQRSQSKVIIP